VRLYRIFIKQEQQEVLVKQWTWLQNNGLNMNKDQSTMMLENWYVTWGKVFLVVGNDGMASACVRKRVNVSWVSVTPISDHFMTSTI